MKANRFLIIFFLLGVVVFIRWWFFYNQSLSGIDDANIYFVYAKNIAEGHGMVYNPGGERVEGFTSFLWVLVLTLLRLAGPMEILTILLNLVLISFTLMRLTAFADRLNNTAPSRPVGVAGLIILAFICLIPGYTDWTILTLMETGLWSCLLVLISLNLFKILFDPETGKTDRELLIFLPLLIFTRPESIAWGLIFIAIRFGQFLYSGNSALVSLRKTLPLFASWAGPLVILILFRLSYFGYPLPNTYYVKVSPDMAQNLYDGFYYLLRYVKENPFIPFFLLSCVVSFIFVIREFIRKEGEISAISWMQLTLVFILAIHFIIPFYSGGDHFYLSRFFQPLYPVLLLGAFNFRFWKRHLSFKISKELSPVISVVLGAALCLLILATTDFTFFKTSSILKEFDIAQDGREKGRKLNRLFGNYEKMPSVGTYLAGGLAYTYEGNTIDLLGLNNTLIGHAPKDFRGGYKNHSTFNKEVFYQIKPDIVHMDFIKHPGMAGLNESDSADFQNQVFKYIFLDEKFRSQYVPVVISAPEDNNWYYAYVQNNFLKELQREKQKFYVFSRQKNTPQEKESFSLQLSDHKN